MREHLTLIASVTLIKQQEVEEIPRDLRGQMESVSQKPGTHF